MLEEAGFTANDPTYHFVDGLVEGMLLGKSEKLCTQDDQQSRKNFVDNDLDTEDPNTIVKPE